jgi:hypothetical protein
LEENQVLKMLKPLFDGMAAISNTLFSFLTAGKRVVSIKDTYGGTANISRFPAELQCGRSPLRYDRS